MMVNFVEMSHEKLRFKMKNIKMGIILKKENDLHVMCLLIDMLSSFSQTILV